MAKKYFSKWPWGPCMRILHETHWAAGWKAPEVLYPLRHCLLVNRTNTLLLKSFLLPLHKLKDLKSQKDPPRPTDDGTVLGQGTSGPSSCIWISKGPLCPRRPPDGSRKLTKLDGRSLSVNIRVRMGNDEVSRQGRDLGTRAPPPPCNGGKRSSSVNYILWKRISKNTNKLSPPSLRLRGSDSTFHLPPWVSFLKKFWFIYK